LKNLANRISAHLTMLECALAEGDLSARPSVCLSHSSAALTWLKTSKYFPHNTIERYV